MVKFKVEKISDHVTRIYGICTELMYLVEGNKKAALIDTGSGFGSLKNVVMGLTDKPIIVLLTHGHTDHAMGAAEFDQVYMNHQDDDVFRNHGKEEFRWDGLKLSKECGDVKKEEYIPTADVEAFIPMTSGERFDLGGIHIETYSCSGHTKGSLVMLIEEERMLLLGDSCNGNVFLFEDYSSTVREYHDNLLKLKCYMAGKYDTVLASHGDGLLPLSIMDEVIEVCEAIENGDSDEIPIEFRGNKGLMARKVEAESGQRIDGKTGNIIYNKAKIL